MTNTDLKLLLLVISLSEGYLFNLIQYLSGRPINSGIIAQGRQYDSTLILGDRSILIVMLINGIDQELSCL